MSADYTRMVPTQLQVEALWADLQAASEAGSTALPHVSAEDFGALLLDWLFTPGASHPLDQAGDPVPFPLAPTPTTSEDA